LARSGARAKAAADIPLEQALGLNQQLFQQQMSNPALQAMMQQSNLTAQGAGLATQEGAALASLLTGRAQGLAGLETGEAENLANIQLGLGTNIANLESGLGAAEAAAGQANAEAGMAGFGMLYDVLGEAAGAALGNPAAFAPKPSPGGT
jgi:hypothetical protein